MNQQTIEQGYFRQFVGDTTFVPGYFIYADGEPFLICVDKELAERRLSEQTNRFPSFVWEMRERDVPDDTFVQYAEII